jgi:hypothetical protein
MSPDWQVLLSAYLPVVLYSVVAYAAGRPYRGPAIGERR